MTVSADDVVSSIEMILGITPDQALVDYHLALGFKNRQELGQYMISTDAFQRRLRGEIEGDEWAARVRQASDRKAKLMSFGPRARGILVETDHGLFVVDPEDGGVSQCLVHDGTYADEEIELVRPLLRGGDVLIVGTHLGAHAVRISRECRQLVAIEANPRTFELLEANLALNGCSNTKAINIAANDKAVFLKFLLSRENSGGSKRTPVVSAHYYTYDRPEEIEVGAVPLDILLGARPFDLIVMDIEGSEYFALEGMERILRRAGALAIEFLPHHLQSVAGVSIDEFAAVLLPHFEWLYVPGRGSPVQKSEIGETLRAMYNSGEQYQLICFTKEFPAHWQSE